MYFPQHSQRNDCFIISDFKKVLIYSLNTETEIMNVGRSNFLNHLSVFCVPLKSYTTLVTDLYLIVLGTSHSDYFCTANLVIHIPRNTRSFGLWIISSGTMSHGSCINHSIVIPQTQVLNLTTSFNRLH